MVSNFNEIKEMLLKAKIFEEPITITIGEEEFSGIVEKIRNFFSSYKL